MNFIEITWIQETWDFLRGFMSLKEILGSSLGISKMVTLVKENVRMVYD